MGDSTIAKIDRFFNLVDATIDETAHVLNRTSRTDGVISEAKARKPVVEARATEPARTTAIARSSRVRIIESIDADTGDTTFVVTDGVSRAECATRSLAERVKAGMEADAK